MTTRISYETANMLKEFLGESAPEPIDNYWYFHNGGIAEGWHDKRIPRVPAYQLHDLLSKPFCEAMAKKMRNLGKRMVHGSEWEWRSVALHISGAFIFDGGLPAVEKSLTEMMEGK